MAKNPKEPSINDLAEAHLSGDYTLERIEFMDGDTRTKAKHSYGWSATNYVTEILWEDFEEIWIEYFEHDQRLSRRVFSYTFRERII